MANEEFEGSGPASADDGLFGVPTNYESANVVLIPVPWDVTTSYGGGTCDGPKAILAASPQLDLFDAELGLPYKCGFHLLDENPELRKLSTKLRPKAQKMMAELTSESPDSKAIQKLLEEVNEGCDFMVKKVEGVALESLADGKTVGLIGGDHSTSMGSILAHASYYKGNFSILHFDAHLDLRRAYQGFKNSHASIMYNVMSEEVRPEKLVQVGIRDFCLEEYRMTQSMDDIHCYLDETLAQRKFSGESWNSICEEVVSHLGDRVYISCDIDGLSPDLCPHTGTPVPGGLSFSEWNHMLRAVVKAGKKIIGFDLVEVAPDPDGHDEWDANVGARALYKLCSWAMQSQNLIKG